MQDESNEKELKPCVEILNKLIKNPHSGPFLEPVDPVKLDIPDYFEKIKHPMDLSTMKKKITKYKTKEEFKDDFDLMISNCFIYNHEESYVYNEGKELERYFNNLWSKMFIKKKEREKEVAKNKRKKKVGPMNDDDYFYCRNILNEIYKSKYKSFNWVFMHPVDVNLVPEYSKIIKNPTDLSKIQDKLENRVYENREKFIDELRLMIQNCFTFNSKGSEVYDCGVEMSRLVNELVSDDLYSIVDLQRIIKNLRSRIYELETECEEYLEILLKKLQSESKKNNEKEYSIEVRSKLAESISNMPIDDTTKIAHIIKKGIPDLDLENKDEVEIDFKMIPNFVLKEVEEYLKFKKSLGKSS